VTLPVEQENGATRLFVKHVNDLVASTGSPPIMRTASVVPDASDVNGRANGNTRTVSIAVGNNNLRMLAWFNKRANLEKKIGGEHIFSRVGGPANVKADSFGFSIVSRSLATPNEALGILTLIVRD
jgi:hypothetical protein